MCYSYAFHTVKTDDKTAAILEMLDRKFPGAYKTGDIFPGDAAPAILARGDRIVAVPAVFGFPGFQNGKLLINARGETAAEKKSFAESLKERRILLPATGFYEWSAEKTKYLFSSASTNPFYLCGLYRIINGQIRFVILTRAANESMIEIHDRMPVIVEEDQVRPYLTDPAAAADIIAKASPPLDRRET